MAWTPSSTDSSKSVDYAYDQFVIAREKSFLKAISNFQEELKKRNVKYGRFVVPAFLKPHFITAKQEKILRTVSDSFLSIVNKATNLYFTDPVVAEHFRYPQEMQDLIKIDPGYSRNVVMMRLDGFLEGEALKFIQLNCDAPAGAAYADQLEKIIFETPDLKDFFSEFHFKRDDRFEKIFSALLSAYEEFGGFETPNIAIVDWKTVRTRPEIGFLKAFFEAKGYKATIADPRELKYKSGKLYHGNFRIDLVYRRVICRELAEKAEEIQDFLKAYKERAICMVNPLRSTLASNKTLLSILTNPDYDRYFTDKENEFKYQHLPWTRQVIDAERFYGRRKSYLIDFLKDEKDSLVLKPAIGYGSRGDVAIGSETRDEDWNMAIDKALKNNWVIQEFVNVPKIAVPAVVNNKFEMVYRRVSVGAFVFDWKYAGGISKLGDETVINIMQNGGLIPIVASDDVIDR